MMSKRRINSKLKGKIGERSACQFLHSLGFADARRTSQYRGSHISGDIECPESLPNLHIEVKFGYPNIDSTSAVIMNACNQADCDASGKPWVVLWKPKHANRWRITCTLSKVWPGYWTLSDEDAIKKCLLHKNG